MNKTDRWTRDELSPNGNELVVTGKPLTMAAVINRVKKKHQAQFRRYIVGKASDSEITQHIGLKCHELRRIHQRTLATRHELE